MANVYQVTHLDPISEMIACTGSMVILTTTTLILMSSQLLKLNLSTLTTDGILEDHGGGKINNTNVKGAKGGKRENSKKIDISFVWGFQ